MDKVHSTGGFWLMIGALLLAAPLRLVVWFGIACAVHEAGHWGMLRLLGGEVGTFHLTGLGLVIWPRRGRLFSYREEVLIALAGPLASLLLALGAGAWGRYLGGQDACLLAGVSLTLGLFNLLPAGPLDGGRLLRAAVAQAAGPDAGEKLAGLLTWGFGLLLLGTGAWSLTVHGNGLLLLWGGWLLGPRLLGKANFLFRRFFLP